VLKQVKYLFWFWSACYKRAYTKIILRSFVKQPLKCPVLSNNWNGAHNCFKPRVNIKFNQNISRAPSKVRSDSQTKRFKYVLLRVANAPRKNEKQHDRHVLKTTSKRVCFYPKTNAGLAEEILAVWCPCAGMPCVYNDIWNSSFSHDTLTARSVTALAVRSEPKAERYVKSLHRCLDSRHCYKDHSPVTRL
jgi:hypothetical protein